MRAANAAGYDGKISRKAVCTGPEIRQSLSLRQAALKGKKNEVGTTAYAELIEQVGNVKLYSAFRNVQLAGNLFVGKIFEKRIENLLLAAAQIRNGIGLQTTALAGKDRIHKTREKLPRNPEPSGGYEGE